MRHGGRGAHYARGVIEAWTDAVGALGGNALAAERAAAELARRYAEPHRRYHTRDHIEAVLRDAEWLLDGVLPGRGDRAELRLAICAHDVVYAARPGEDERRSADWARTQLTRAGVGAGSVGRVEALVLATLDHRAADGDVAAAVLLDTDLAILAAPEPAYDAYAHAVRQEYAAVPEDRWRAGRAEVLTDLLDRERLYRTDRAGQRWDGPARANLRRELAQLARPRGVQ
jgi:predicted metal-dependent HD superfamily phosphohydrolase